MIEGREITEKNTLIKKIKMKYREYKAKKIIEEYDIFLVLTEEDKINWGRNNPKIKVINNPLTFYSNKNSSLNEKRVISLGRLHEQKGYDILIDVWKKVNNVHSDWVLEIYGEGEEREKLQNKIDEENLTNTFKLMGRTKEVYKELLNSSIYVLSSRFEGFGMVLIEAMVCGVPIVSFDCPCGPKDIILDGKNGYLCKFGDIDDMVKKIIYLIENGDKRKEMGEIGKKLSSKYLEDNIMNQWKELYENK